MGSLVHTEQHGQNKPAPNSLYRLFAVWNHTGDISGGAFFTYIDHNMDGNVSISGILNTPSALLPGPFVCNGREALFEGPEVLDFYYTLVQAI